MKAIVRFWSVIVLAAVLFTGAAVPAGAALFYNFWKQDGSWYTDYNDVKWTDWFSSAVWTVGSAKLMRGKGEGVFDPGGGITVAETLTVAARLHAIYTTGEGDFPAGNPWYAPYLDYCLKNGIIDSAPADMNTAATRALFASVMARSLPDEVLRGWNIFDDGDIPDVSLSDSFGPAVYKLYRAGILTGNDERRTFAPQSGIRRCEVAAILERMIDREKRVSTPQNEKGGSLAGLYYLTPYFHVLGRAYYIMLYTDGTGIMNGPVGAPEAGDTLITDIFDLEYSLKGDRLTLPFRNPEGKTGTLLLRVHDNGGTRTLEYLNDFEVYHDYSLTKGAFFAPLTVRSPDELEGKTFRLKDAADLPADQVPTVSFFRGEDNYIYYNIRFFLENGEEVNMLSATLVSLMENSIASYESNIWDSPEGEMVCSIQFGMLDWDLLRISLRVYAREHYYAPDLDWPNLAQHNLGRITDGAEFELVVP